MLGDDTHSFKWIRFRSLILAFLLLCSGVAVGVKAFRLQVLEGSKYRALARDQYVRSFELPAPRGVIYDRDGHELAISHDVASVYADPRRIGDVQKAARSLARVLGVDQRRLQRRLASNKAFVWVARRVGNKKAEEVKRLKISGVGLTMEPRRFYPNGTLAAQILGFAGVDSVGLEGLEKRFDNLLKGGDQVIQGFRDALGRGGLLDAPRPIESLTGKGIVLTIDSAVQHVLEQALAEGVAKTGAKAGIGVVLDPRTGDVLAMASEPGYDPNRFSEYSASRRRNRAVTDVFEPGSTFKIFTYAAALDAGLIRPDDIIDCENSNYLVSNHVIHDAHPHGRLTITEAFKVSSNIAASKIGKKIGAAKLYAYLKKFGFGSRTGIELPGEARGILPVPSRWRPINLATISFGQGVSASAIQIAAATAAVANRGVLMRPRLVMKILNPDGSVAERFPAQKRGRVIGAETARVLTRIMEKVTEPGGTGRRAVVKGFKVAGKTGTAQKVDPVAGGYSKEKRVGSFVGFVPAEDPRLVIFIAMDEPKGVTYGGVVAAPVFSKVAEAALARFGVQPDLAATFREKARTGKDEELAEGDVQELDAPEQDITATALKKGRIPDFRGYSMRKALETASALGIELEVIGTGIATKQYPPPGRQYSKNQSCKIWFRPSAGRRKGT